MKTTPPPAKTTPPLPATTVAILDRITDRTPDDLAEIKELLALARTAILEDQSIMACDWVDQATDLLDLVAQRLGYVLPE